MKQTELVSLINAGKPFVVVTVVSSGIFNGVAKDGGKPFQLFEMSGFTSAGVCTLKKFPERGAAPVAASPYKPGKFVAVLSGMESPRAARGVMCFDAAELHPLE